MKLNRPLLPRCGDVLLWLVRCPVTWCVLAGAVSWWVA